MHVIGFSQIHYVMHAKRTQTRSRSNPKQDSSRKDPTTHNWIFLLSICVANPLAPNIFVCKKWCPVNRSGRMASCHNGCTSAMQTCLNASNSKYPGSATCFDLRARTWFCCSWWGLMLYVLSNNLLNQLPSSFWIKYAYVLKYMLWLLRRHFAKI